MANFAGAFPLSPLWASLTDLIHGKAGLNSMMLKSAVPNLMLPPASASFSVLHQLAWTVVSLHRGGGILSLPFPLEPRGLVRGTEFSAREPWFTSDLLNCSSTNYVMLYFPQLAEVELAPHKVTGKYVAGFVNQAYKGSLVLGQPRSLCRLQRCLTDLPRSGQ